MKTKIFSLVLILAVIGLYSGSAYSQNRTHPKKEFFKQQMMQKLNLTDEQKTKIEDARLNHQKQMIDLKANLAKKMLVIKELRVKGNLDRNDVIAAVKDINQAKNDIAIARANNMMDIYEILTPDQRKIWKDDMGSFNGLRGDRMGGMWNHRGPDENNSGPMHRNMQ
ncbi:MAG: Spy/CpxP family protein refolding chaperone [Ignavibacteriaceae bacterium]